MLLTAEKNLSGKIIVFYRPLKATGNEEFGKNCVRFAHYFDEAIYEERLWCWTYIFSMDFEISLLRDGVFVKRTYDKSKLIKNFEEKQNIFLK